MAATAQVYSNARKLLGEASIHFVNDTIKALIVSSSYTLDLDNHKFLSDVTGEVTTNGASRKTLTNKTWAVVAGQNKCKLSSDPVSWTASGGPIAGRRLVFFKDTGTAGTSPLLWTVLPDSTPADVSVPDGGTWTESPDATDGWFKT